MFYPFEHQIALVFAAADRAEAWTRGASRGCGFSRSEREDTARGVLLRLALGYGLWAPKAGLQATGHWLMLGSMHGSVIIVTD